MAASIARMTRSIGRRLSDHGDDELVEIAASARCAALSAFPSRQHAAGLLANKPSTTISKPFKELERGP
jgi:hypothetical protein